MFIILLLHLSNGISQSSFLSLSQPDYIPSTSSGALASGIHNIDNSISDLSSQLTKSLQALGLKIDFSISTTTTALITLISSEISDKKNQLDSINNEIHLLLHNTEGLYNRCSGFRTCDACQYNPLCVWCDIEKLCVGGDADGPFHGECSSFSYQNCYTNGCRAYTRCRSCVGSLQCGWCLDGGGCSDTADSCDYVLFVHSNSPGTVCPTEDVSYPEIYINSNPTSSDYPETLESEKKVMELRSISVKLVQEIQELEYAKARLISELEESNKKIPGIIIEDKNNGLEGRVGRLAAEELSLTGSTERKKSEDGIPELENLE